MPHHLGVRTISLVCVVTLPLVACDKGGLKGPEAEVKKTDVKLDLPGVPSFDLPSAPGDGSRSVKELRVKGRKLLDTEITVHGFVTWAYDCKTSIRKPDESDKDVQARIDEDPTLCERAKFYIGDDRGTPPEKSLWIVDVPRPYNALEIKRIKKKDRIEPDRCEPDAKPDQTVCPPYAIGDEVVITGTFKTSSPHSERNSDGLLVYKKLKNLTQGWESPHPIEGPAGGMGGGGGGPVSPEDLVRRGG
jgi:hypothetical protein